MRIINVKKFVIAMLVLAVITASVIALVFAAVNHNVVSKEWQVVVIEETDVFDNKNAEYVYSVEVQNGTELEIHTFTSFKEWTKGDVISVFVKAFNDGHIEVSKGRNLTDSELYSYQKNKAAEAFNEISNIAKAHLELCKENNSLFDRYDDSKESIVAIEKMIAENNLEYWYDTYELGVIRNAAEYVF